MLTRPSAEADGNITHVSGGEPDALPLIDLQRLVAFDPRFGDAIDPRFLVYERRAFPGFITPNEHDQVLDWIGNRTKAAADPVTTSADETGSASERPTGPAEISGPDAINGASDEPGINAEDTPETAEEGTASRSIIGRARLPLMRCGMPTKDGTCCGRAILARADVVRNILTYHGRCRARVDGHVGQFSDAVENAVITIVARAYSPDALRRAAAEVSARVDNDRTALTGIDERLRRVRKEQIALGHLEVEAKVDGRAQDMEDYQDLRHALQAQRADLERQRRAVEDALRGATEDDNVKRSLRIVRTAAQSLDALFEHAAASPSASRALIGVLTRRILLTKPGEGLVLVHVEFLNGAVAQELLVTEAITSTQPQRVLAHFRFARGDTPADIAKALVLAPAEGKNRRRIRPGIVATLALQHAYLEPVPPRIGAGETLAGVAARVRGSEAPVYDAFLAGALGPTTLLADGTPTVQPTDAELAASFPEFGRQSAADSKDWEPDDTMLFLEAAQRYGVTFTELVRSRDWRKCDARDPAGRRYLNERDLPASIVGAGPRTRVQLEAEYRAAVQAAVVAAGYPSDRAVDFVPFRPLLLRLRHRFDGPSTVAFYNAGTAGRIATLPFDGPPPPSQTLPQPTLVYCPRAVRDAKKKTVVMRWLAGAHRLPRAAVPDALPTRRRGRPRSAVLASSSTRRADSSIAAGAGSASAE